VISRIRYNLTLHIALALLLTAGGTAAIILNRYALLVFIFPAMIYSIHALLSIYRRNAGKIAFILDAIENSDYTVKFAKSPTFAADQTVNQALNRITHILYQAKIETIQKEKMYEQIMNSVSTGILVIDQHENIIQSNNEALRLLGISVLTHCRQLNSIDEKLYETISAIPPSGKQQITLHNERGEVSLSVRSSAITLQSRHITILAINDINRELDEKEIDAWVRLTRVLTHEIMNSITPVTSLSATLLANNRNASPDMLHGLETINATGKSLMSFVESYRRFTHIPTPRPSLFDLASFIERMKRLALSNIPDGSIRITTSINPDNLILHADENLISQVMLNLLKNAQQAIGIGTAGGHIRIKAWCEPDESITIETSNNGAPIPPEIIPQIFIPFFSTKEGGSGIGLSISRQIMRLHGGSLSLNPNASETTFIMRFP
jgi:nitrogen fixation/metabolism regulation signal transduction histidine kinase